MKSFYCPHLATQPHSGQADKLNFPTRLIIYLLLYFDVSESLNGLLVSDRIKHKQSILCRCQERESEEGLGALPSC